MHPGGSGGSGGTHTTIQVMGEGFKRVSLPGKYLRDYWLEPNQAIWLKSDLFAYSQKTFEIYSNPIIEPEVDVFANKGIIAFYRFDGNAEDALGNYNGTVNGNVSFPDGYSSRQCIDFGNVEQTTNYVRINNIPILSNMSFAFWFNLHKYNSVSPNQSTFISISSPSQENEFILVYDNRSAKKEIELYIRNVNDDDYRKWNYVPTLNEWIHIVLSISGTEYTLYINGAFCGTVSYKNINTSISGNNCLVLGQKQNSFGGGFSTGQSLTGMLDNFRIYNYALSYEEVDRLYKHEKAYFSNGKRVFELFDDFNAPELDTNVWAVEGTGNLKLENGYLKTKSNLEQDFVVKTIDKVQPVRRIGIGVNFKDYEDDTAYHCQNIISIMNANLTGLYNGCCSTTGHNVALNKVVGGLCDGNYYIIGDVGNFYTVLFTYFQNESSIRCLINGGDEYLVSGQAQLKEIEIIAQYHVPILETDYVFVANNDCQSLPQITSINQEDCDIRYRQAKFKKKHIVTIYNSNSNDLNNFQIRIPLSDLQLNDDRVAVFERI